MGEQRLDPFKTTVVLGVRLPELGVTDIEVPLLEAFTMYTTIQTAGYSNTVTSINFARKMSATLLDLLGKTSLDHSDRVSIGSAKLGDMLGLFNLNAPANALNEAQLYQLKKQHEQLVIGFCYTLLRARVISRPKAAEIATALLNPEKPINVDAWRLKVDRWADRQNPKLPPVEIRKRGKAEDEK